MRAEYDVVFFDLYGTLVDGHGAAIDGAHELLRSFPGGRWAVVTSSGRRFAQSLLESAGLPCPSVLIAAEDVAAGKPAPDCYLQAAEAFDVPPARCLVIEDSVAGATAARLAEMDVIRVGSSCVLRDLQFRVNENGSIAVEVALASRRLPD